MMLMTQQIRDAICAEWPEHIDALSRMEAATTPALAETAETVSRLILQLAHDELPRLARGYRWICNMAMEEELEFRRTGHYRYSTFAETSAQVYSNDALMATYMDGLLITHAVWLNHLGVMDFYIREYLPIAAPGASHLEVGPGHGLLLCLAARAGASSVDGWDISEASLAQTRAALTRLEVKCPVNLICRSIFDHSPLDHLYQSIVISEVLEHLEDPRLALEMLYKSLDRSGHIFVRSPVNSPMIDHIWLYREPEELVAMVESVGFRIKSKHFAPVSGYSEARARKLGLPISCAVIGVKP